ncbi:MAG: polyribonucleotide nucleotidyltransferase [Patescibacteria group bacterium]
MNKILKKQTVVNGVSVTLETGVLAPQANMAILATVGETVVLATVVCNEPKLETDFFPLRVDYEEKLYAGGFIKTSRFIKREGRPSDDAVISGRLIDHAIRPLFPKDFMYDTQVVVTVLSHDGVNNPDIVAMTAVSAALSASDIPFNGPFATTRVGMVGGNFVANPPMTEKNGLELDMIMSALKDRVLAVEASAKIVPEDKILGALDFGFKSVQPTISFIEEFAKELEVKKMTYKSKTLDEKLLSSARELVLEDVKKAVVSTWIDRVDATTQMEEKMFKALEGKYTKSDMKRALFELEKEVTRHLIVDEGKRPDGRALDEVRAISCQVGVLPRTHGSGLFMRGLTQSLTVATLGSASLEQLIQNMFGEETKRYMHHYNGPAFSLGEIGNIGNPGRREVGHGALAEKALLPVIPSKDEFPYTIRLVSEILSQQGSSSMAATCGSTLALMDAGIPIKAPVAGIAMGLMADKDESRYVVLTDIANFEDFYGYMDFKMAGTREGITAIQMDIKLPGIPLVLFSEIMEKSKVARLKILDVIEAEIKSPRSALSKHAPKVIQIFVKKDQIGLVIGGGGKTIREIMEKSGATVDIEEKDDKGVVNIAAKDQESLDKAKAIVENLVKEIKAGEIYDGKVMRIVDFGAFVGLVPGKEGLLHISEMAHNFVSHPSDVVSEGQVVKVKVLETGMDGKISLSMKALVEAPEGSQPYTPREPRPQREGGFGRPSGSGRFSPDRGKAGMYDSRPSFPRRGPGGTPRFGGPRRRSPGY